MVPDVTVLYTSYNQIRAAMGVDNEEISNEVMDGLQLADQLTVDLDACFPAHAAIAANATGATPSPQDLEQFRLLRLYSQYSLACRIGLAGEAIYPVKISDGQNEIQRSNKIDFGNIRTAICGQANAFKNQLLALLGTPVAARSANLFGVAKPAYDPVLGPCPSIGSVEKALRR